MTVGLGVSIGTVNTVCAVAQGSGGRHGPGHRSAVRRPGGPPATWRTTLTFDSTGTARVGRIPKHGRAITDFADLTERSAPTARVGHRALSPADLVATVAASVLEDVLGAPPAPDHGITVTHPVGYPVHRMVELREALDAVGLQQAALAAEPVAATAWLEEACGPLLPGLALVYDLGGSGLRVTLVRVGAGCPSDPVVGESLRSTDFGGRAFGAYMARSANWRSADTPHVATDAVITELRTAHVRKSLEVVYRCLRVADVTMADVDRVLVIGGAARPPEVAAVLASALARPVIVAPDPERTVAEGAAILARRAAEAELGTAGHRRGRWTLGQIRLATPGIGGRGRRLSRAAVTAALVGAGALFGATAVAGDAASVAAVTPEACMVHLYR
ncbi:Hsp70 family protein [Nocardia wallacei]|uniref:Hsp70 family protein n=1 Tax=Nocardia wallacei TaxID=480035 RepID=UPI00245751B9|nr:Hsp70 family protein [Nocardia wallacei]